MNRGYLKFLFWTNTVSVPIIIVVAPFSQLPMWFATLGIGLGLWNIYSLGRKLAAPVSTKMEPK